MYVPIVIDPCAFYEYRYLWEYLKYEYHCYQNNWPIVACEKYQYYREKRPISNVYEDEFCRLHQYKVLSGEEEASVKKYFIPEIVFQELEQKCGSKLGMKLFLLKNRYKPLEKAVKNILLQIQKDTGKKIKGILNWNAHFVSIRYVAEKMKIPVITNEFSIRFPEYYPLGYFSQKEIYDTEEINMLYGKYLQEKERLSFRQLSRKEILALLIDKERMDELDKLINTIPEYEIGIAGCHPLIATFFAKSTYTDLELIEDVRQRYSEEDILFRKHPGDEPYQAEYTVRNRDTSRYASEFLVKCKRITAVGSNILLEAMLWGKVAYSKDISPYTIFCEKSLDNKENISVEDDILNVIFFGYLVPYNQMFNEAYMDWRIEEDNIIKIMEKNVKYYFHEMNIPESVLEMTEDRYEKILSYKRGTK